jgi:hypothetical protein
MNENIYRWIAILLLAFNVGGALYGGFSLVNDPSGSDIGLSLDLLSQTPFVDYKIPGIVLLAVNGGFCSVVLLYTIFKWRGFEKLLIIQGLLLTGWIVIQMLMINMIFILHFVLGGCGVYFFFAGLMLIKHRDNASRHGTR